MVAKLAWLCFFALAMSSPAEPPAKTPLQWAESLVEHIEPQNNEYVYRPIRVTWAGEAGSDMYSCHADCSGFYTLLLEQAYGWDAARFKRWLGSSRPLAHAWHDAIVDEKGFSRIRAVMELKPGDVIAVKYQAGEQKDTGHVMLVAAEPTARNATEPIIPGTKQWEVAIIDSSKSGHGPTDTRRQSDKSFHSGVGRGVLRLYGDEKGEFAGYSWSTTKASTFESAAKHPIAAGRLDPQYQP